MRLVFVSADNAEELAEAIASHPHMEVISIYGLNHKHWAWLKPKEKKKGTN